MSPCRAGGRTCNEAADLVEEITRIVGVDRGRDRAAAARHRRAEAVLTLRQNRCIMARRTLAARGMVEAVTWSFIPKAHAEAFGGGAPEIALSNPISSEMSDMRPNLLPGLITAAQKRTPTAASTISRCSRSVRSISVTGRSINTRSPPVSGAGPPRPTARDATGPDRQAPWTHSTRRPIAMAVLAALGAPVANVQVQPGGGDWYHPGRSGLITLGPKNVLARFGELHPRTLAALDAEGPMVAFEILIDAIPVAKAKGDQGAASARCIRPDAPETRLRLPGRRRREGRRHPPGGARGRQATDQRRHGCSTSSPARASARAASRSPSR